MRLALTAAVTVSSDERVSKMKLLKTLLQTTMMDYRLEDLMVIACEKNILDKLDLNTLVQKWIKVKTRKIDM